MNPQPLTPNPTPVVVVKLGGAILGDPDAVRAVWSEIARLGDAMYRPDSAHGDTEAGTPGVVVVHGGGAQSTELARRLGHEPRIVAGRRVTSDLDLDVSLYALRGALNARLVGAARAAGVAAVGLSGADGALATVVRRPPREIDGETVDFGWVGDVDRVDSAVLRVLLAAGFVPVVSTVCADDRGALYNVNADTVAAAKSPSSSAATRLDLVTECGRASGATPPTRRPAGFAHARPPPTIEAGRAPTAGSPTGCVPSWRWRSRHFTAASRPSAFADLTPSAPPASVTPRTNLTLPTRPRGGHPRNSVSRPSPLSLC